MLGRPDPTHELGPCFMLGGRHLAGRLTEGLLLFLAAPAQAQYAQDSLFLDLEHVFELEYATDWSPLAHVDQVSTPTMLMTGTADYRTPMSESEQFYQALKLRVVETALVRVLGASHGIGARPSQMAAKPAHVLEWFQRRRRPSPCE